MTRQLKIIYLLSILPLSIGNLTFFYWFYKRTWFADNVEIELVAFFTILGFLLFALTTLILSIVFVVKNRTDWIKIIIPIVIVGMTFPVIDLYGTLHTSLSDKAFVRIINDTDKQIKRIWSENFEMTYFENKGYDFVISFYPVYTYDWTQEYSSGMFNYKVNTLRIDLKQKNDSIVIYTLPDFSKGDCETIRLTEIIKKNKLRPANNCTKKGKLTQKKLENLGIKS